MPLPRDSSHALCKMDLEVDLEMDVEMGLAEVGSRCRGALVNVEVPLLLHLEIALQNPYQSRKFPKTLDIPPRHKESRAGSASVEQMYVHRDPTLTETATETAATVHQVIAHDPER